MREPLSPESFSASELELLRLLSRSPETFWSPSAAANVIEADERAIAAFFARCEKDGLFERGRQSDAFRFAPMREDDRAAIAELTATARSARRARP